MLRTFIRATCTPERAALLIRVIDLIENAGYLNMIDSLESVVARDPEGESSELRGTLERSIGDVVEAIYNAHSIRVTYDINRVEDILQHLTFLIYFNTPFGYRPELSSEYDLYEYGDDATTILANLYDESGHNLSGEPTDWVDEVGLSLITNIVKAINANNKQNIQFEDITIITGEELDAFKKFAAIFPESLTVKHIKSTRGVVCNINELFFLYSEKITSLSAQELAVEILGFSIISHTPKDVSKGTYAKGLVETTAGQGTRALDVVNHLSKVIEKVGLK